MNPIVKISKNNIILKNPYKLEVKNNLLSSTAQGNKNITSRSKIINKIATK